VNFVTARKTLKERGIRLDESVGDVCKDYASLVQITVEGERSLTVAGTLFGKGEPRIVRVDDFSIEGTLSGSLLFTKNRDTPGVIGSVGTTLGNSGINIGSMHLGRGKQKGEAIALIHIDSELAPETLESMRRIHGITSVIPMSL
jgi:D-3-phosphoglycerate dehydrogenase